MDLDCQRKVATLVQQACLAEVSFPKPGNVGPEAGFADACRDDFIQSAAAIASDLSEVHDHGIGETIRRAVHSTRRVVGHNTNLGIILLLSPLAAVPEDQTVAEGIESILGSLTVEDATAAYKGIQASMAAGLGTAEDQDIAAPPTINLRQCMSLAADRDLIARQYANGFREVLTFGVPLLQQTCAWQRHHEHRLAWLALQFLSRFEDSLILRKRGAAVARDVQRRAAQVVNIGWPHDPRRQSAYDEFDAFLRTPDHSLNPGTTADLVAATLFVAMRDHGCFYDHIQQRLTIPDC